MKTVIPCQIHVKPIFISKTIIDKNFINPIYCLYRYYNNKLFIIFKSHSDIWQEE